MPLHSPDLFFADPPAGFDGQWGLWDYLNGAFQKATGRPIQFMDIDAHCEIGGHHLVIETKREGVPVPYGQKKALKALWAKGYHMVIFLWGKDDPIEAEIYWPGGEKTKVWKDKLTRKRLFEICENWARWADKNPSPFQYRDPA